MGQIGRLDLGHSLRQYAEVSGGYSPQLGEGIVPTIELGRLTGSPFSVEEPWAVNAQVTNVAAENGWAVIVGSGLPARSWISVWQILINAPNLQRVQIRAYALADVPALNGVSNTRVNSSRQADDTGLRLLGEVQIRTGTTAAGIINVGLNVNGNASGSTLVVPVQFDINQFGALVVRAETVNSQLEVGFQGHLHVASGR